MKTPFFLSALLAAASLQIVASVPARAEAVNIAAFGDSLMAGYGLPSEEGFTAQLQRELVSEGLDVRIDNLSVSGNTTADGLTRIRQVIDSRPAGVMLALGSNDALRRLSPDAASANIDKMLKEFKAAGIPVLLVGAQAPLNWGLAYKQEFDGIYPQLARSHSVPLYPFILEGVALRPELNQSDGVHPNAAGVQEMVARMTPHVQKFIASLSS